MKFGYCSCGETLIFEKIIKSINTDYRNEESTVTALYKYRCPKCNKTYKIIMIYEQEEFKDSDN